MSDTGANDLADSQPAIPAETKAPAADSTKKAKKRQHRLLLFAKFLGRHERILGVLNTTITAAFTVILAVSTVLLWKETKDLRDFAQEQGGDMKASIAEAARSAVAMQNVAAAVGADAKIASDNLALYKDANVRQMRAYLIVGFGAVLKQDMSTNYHFEVRMNVQNVGNTPAYKVQSNVHVDVLPYPLPSDFQLPEFFDTKSNGIIGPHQSYIVSGFANRLYSEDDVHEISFGNSRRLYVFGAVRYKDAFGTERQTQFCEAILWLKNDSFMTTNAAKFNDAD